MAKKKSYAPVIARILMDRAKRNMELEDFSLKDILLDTEKAQWEELACAIAFNFYQLSQSESEGDIRHLGKGRYRRIGGVKSTRVSGTKRIMEF